jgi:hypothetical protein
VQKISSHPVKKIKNLQRQNCQQIRPQTTRIFTKRFCSIKSKNFQKTFSSTQYAAKNGGFGLAH